MRTTILLVIALLPVARVKAATIPEYSYRIIHVYPHDPGAFTEGLFYLDGFLYEATGLAGKSSVRKVELKTGAVLQKQDVPPPYFGEGIVALHNQILQLTYTTETGFMYDLKTLKPKRDFNYRGQGWSLTFDGKQIVMDDGTPELRFWDSDTLKETGRVTVTADGVPLKNINELEWVKGEIYANVWHTDRIACIDPKTGMVRAWINLKGLLPASDVLRGWEGAEQVLNGIAYDAANDRLFVTGKYWPKLFEIKVNPEPQRSVARSGPAQLK